MTTQPLYRSAALNAHKTKWLGDIVLVRPISYRVLTAAAVVMAVLIVAFLTWGTYTKRSTVVGQLMPDIGVVKVYTPQVGIIQKKHVTEGQHVNKGDVLYALSSDRHNAMLGSIQATISQQVEARRNLLQEELDKTQRLQQAELAKLDSLIAGQRARVALSKDTVARYQGLLDQDYISREQLQQKQADLLDQRARLDSLERDRISLTNQIEQSKSQLERGKSSIDQELAESEGKRQIYITAPEAGTITAVVADLGQAVDGSRPLVSIVPDGAKLQAQLYAPSRAVGFIRPGETVLLRYQAYPYEKFGHARGKVLSVAKTALPSADITSFAEVSGGRGQQSEPVYLITVGLDSQTIMAYGKPQHLQSGMMLEADILQDTRRLYEWVLEPLYSLSGKY